MAQRRATADPALRRKRRRGAEAAARHVAVPPGRDDLAARLHHAAAGNAGARLSAARRCRDEERRLYESHPEIAGKLLGTIPRLEAVAAMVAGQMQVPATRSRQRQCRHLGSRRRSAPPSCGPRCASIDTCQQGRIPEQAAQFVQPGRARSAAGHHRRPWSRPSADDSGLVMTPQGDACASSRSA